MGKLYLLPPYILPTLSLLLPQRVQVDHFHCYIIFFQVKLTETILSNSTRKLLWFEITKMRIPVKNTFIVLFIVIFGTLSISTQWRRQSSGKQSHTWQYCCLPSYAFDCASVIWRFLQSVQRFQFFIRPDLHFFTDFHRAFSQWYVLLHVRSFTANIKHKVRCKL